MHKLLITSLVISAVLIPATAFYMAGGKHAFADSEYRHTHAGYGGKMRNHREKIFTLFDQNGDLKVSKEEFTLLLSSRFDQVDSDKDGHISPEEINRPLYHLWKERG